MMIESPNPMIVWIQTPDGSINILELRQVRLVIKDEQEQLQLHFKNADIMAYMSDNPLYPDLKDQLVRSHFLRLNEKPKVKLTVPKPEPN